MKIKVTAKKSNTSTTKSNHIHKWEKITRTNRVWVVDREAYDEGVYEERYKCTKCDYSTKVWEDMESYMDSCDSGWSVGDVKVGTKHHNEEGHYENKVEVIDCKCTICGILDSQL